MFFLCVVIRNWRAHVIQMSIIFIISSSVFVHTLRSLCGVCILISNYSNWCACSLNYPTHHQACISAGCIDACDDMFAFFIWFIFPLFHFNFSIWFVFNFCGDIATCLMFMLFYFVVCCMWFDWPKIISKSKIEYVF